MERLPKWVEHRGCRYELVVYNECSFVYKDQSGSFIFKHSGNRESVENAIKTVLYMNYAIWR